MVLFYLKKYEVNVRIHNVHTFGVNVCMLCSEALVKNKCKQT